MKTGKVSLILLVFAACFGLCSCNSDESSSTNKHVHHSSTEKWFSDSDNHWQICDDDLENFNISPHTWDGGVVTKEATCTESGTKLYTCSICGKTKTESINASGHDYSGGWISDEDYHWHSCTHGDSITDKALHTWDGGTQTVAPTHFIDGNIEYKCLVCQKTKNVVVPKENHISDQILHSNGTHHWYECVIDGAHIDEQPHNYDSGTITKEATCLEDGTILYRCLTCGYEYETTIVHTGHSSQTWHHDESKHWKVCDKDGVIFQESSHNFNQGTIVKQPTCNSDGLKRYTCQNCGYYKEEVLDKHPNSKDVVNDVGSFKICNECGDVIKNNHYHDYSETESNGIYTFRCKSCGYSTTRNVSSYTFTYATRGGNTYYYQLSYVSGSSIIIPNTHNGLEVDPVKLNWDSNPEFIHFNNSKVKQSTLNEEYKNFGSNVKFIYLNTGFTTIHYNSFANTSNLMWIDFLPCVTSISEKAFLNTNLKIINIPSTLTTINPNAFGESMNLKTINIKGENHSIANHAFCNLPVLETINFEYALGSLFYMLQSDSYYYGTTMNDLTLRSKYYTYYSTEDYEYSQYACPTTFWPNSFKKITVEKGNSNGTTRSFKFLSYITGFEVVYLSEFHPTTVSSSSLCFAPHIDNLFFDKLKEVQTYGLHGYQASSVFIPLSCKTIGSYAVLPTGGRIYCEAERELAGWSSNWNKPYDGNFPYKNQTVYWNSTYGG